MESATNPKLDAKELQPGDNVLIYRPLSAIAKRTKMPWIGPYEVIATNRNVVQITDDEGHTDWVHRSHCSHQKKRNPHLGLPPPFIPMNPILRETEPVKILKAVKLTEEPEEMAVEEPDESIYFDLDETVTETISDNDTDDTRVEQVSHYETDSLDGDADDTVIEHRSLRHPYKDMDPATKALVDQLVEEAPERYPKRSREKTKRFQATISGKTHE